MSHRSKQRAVDAEALEVGLQYALDGNPLGDERVRIALSLSPAVPIREGQRARTRASALRAFRATQRELTRAEASEGSGSRDTYDTPVHTAQVEGHAGMIRMADVENIDAEKAKSAARAIEEALTLERAWEAGDL